MSAEGTLSRVQAFAYVQAPTLAKPLDCSHLPERFVPRRPARFPYKERAHMPGSTTTPGRLSASVITLKHIVFRSVNGVGTHDR